jgi:hypothetical protein
VSGGGDYRHFTRTVKLHMLNVIGKALLLKTSALVQGINETDITAILISSLFYSSD